MGLTSPRPTMVPNRVTGRVYSSIGKHGVTDPWEAREQQRRASGRGEIQASRIIAAMRDTDTSRQITREEYNRQEAEREIDALFTGESYQYHPWPGDGPIAEVNV